MKKSVLFLLALSGCVRLNYVDIPAPENSYKFRYVGENALVECVDEKLADRMCEKDGITPANGIWAQEISGKKYGVNYTFFSSGLKIASELYDENAGAGIKGYVEVDGNSYTYCRNGNLCNISCKVFNDKFIYITGDALSIWVKAKGADALKCAFIEGYLEGYYGKDKAIKLISKNSMVADVSWDFIRQLDKTKGNPDKKIIFKDKE